MQTKGNTQIKEVGQKQSLFHYLFTCFSINFSRYCIIGAYELELFLMAACHVWLHSMTCFEYVVDPDLFIS